MTLDLVTVAYAGDMDLLRTQARSIDLRFQPNDIHEIRVMINDDPLDIDMSWWGQHSDKVKVIHRRAVGYWPAAGISGWESQQVMKLLGARDSTADWCMVLDSKTWFVKDYDPCLIFSGDRVRFGWFDSAPQPFRKGLAHVESLFGISSGKYLSPGGVPFMMKPRVVREMFLELQALTGKDLVEWFDKNCRMDVNGVTEFTCYSAFVNYAYVKDSLYGGDQAITVHNLADWQLADFDDWYDGLWSEDAFTASIQYRASKLLSEEQQSKWNLFLESKGLA